MEKVWQYLITNPETDRELGLENIVIFCDEYIGSRIWQLCVCSKSPIGNIATLKANFSVSMEN